MHVGQFRRKSRLHAETFVSSAPKADNLTAPASVDQRQCVKAARAMTPVRRAQPKLSIVPMITYSV